MEERKLLSLQLLSIMDEFQKLGISRNYAKLLENQLAVIGQRIEPEVGDVHKDLRSARIEIEKNLTLVNKSLQEVQIVSPSPEWIGPAICFVLIPILSQLRRR